MPGRRFYTEKETVVSVRLPAGERDAWRAHVKKHGGYVSVLVRRAVKEHLGRPHTAVGGNRETYYT